MHRNTLSVRTLAGLLVLTGIGISVAQETPPDPADERDPAVDVGGWGYGFELGATLETTEGSVFTLNFYADHYVQKAFSAGGMILLSPWGDSYSQAAVAGTAKFHIVAAEKLDMVPYVGVGFFYAEAGTSSDVSLWIPIAVTGAWTVSPNIALTATLGVNLYNLKFDPPLEDDATSSLLLVGVRYQPGS